MPVNGAQAGGQQSSRPKLAKARDGGDFADMNPRVVPTNDRCPHQPARIDKPQRSLAVGAALALALWVVAGPLVADEGQAVDGEREVVFSVDFEAEDWRQGIRGTEGGDLRIMSPGDDGFDPLDGRALRVTVPEGQHTGSVLAIHLADHLAEEPERLYFRYHIRLADDWDTPDGGKLPGFAGTYGRMGWGGRPSDGTEGWSLRGLFLSGRQRDRLWQRLSEEGAADGAPDDAGSRVAVGTYAYHADMTGTYGDHWTWQPAGWLRPGQWHLVEQLLDMNHPDRADGVFTVWVDGRRVHHDDQLRLRRNDRLRIQTVWMNVYHGGRTPAPRDLVLDIDNIVVKERRGEM